MTKTIEIDDDTAQLVHRLARLARCEAGVVIKNAVAAQAAASSPTSTSRTQRDPPDVRVRRALAQLEALPERSEDDSRTDSQIIGYDAHGLP